MIGSFYRHLQKIGFGHRFHYHRVQAMNRKHLALVLLVAGFAAPAPAQTDPAIEQLTDDYFAKRPSQSFHAGLSMEAARKVE